LEKLADSSHHEAVAILRQLPKDSKVETLTRLQNLMGEDPQSALDSYIILKESLNSENAKSVNAILHAGQQDLINKYEHLSTANEKLRNLFNRPSLHPDLSFGEQLRSHLLDGFRAPEDAIGSKNTGYSARQFLHMLSAFASENKDGKLVNVADLSNRLASLLPTEETHSWINKAESFHNLEKTNLSRLATLAEELVNDGDFVQSMEKRFKDEQARVEAQAIADIHAQKITGVSSPEQSQIEQNVLEGSSLKNPEAKSQLDTLLDRNQWIAQAATNIGAGWNTQQGGY
jgi:hypothetical protein